MDLETITYEVFENTATISFNRPEVRNAFNSKMIEDVLVALKEAEADKSIRCVILTGKGLGFSAGADLSSRDGDWKDTEDALIRGYMPSLQTIMNMPKPIISAVNGAAAGIGSAYAMACDLTIMADDAYILEAFSNIGLIPDGGANWFLTNTVGYKLAYQIAIEGERLAADRCFELGLANKVVPKDKLMNLAQDWASKLAKRSPQSLMHTKRVMRKAMNSEYEDIYKIEAETQNKIIGSPDNIEGVQSFLEKRPPNFK